MESVLTSGDSVFKLGPASQLPSGATVKTSTYTFALFLKSDFPYFPLCVPIRGEPGSALLGIYPVRHEKRHEKVELAEVLVTGATDLRTSEDIGSTFMAWKYAVTVERSRRALTKSWKPINPRT